MSCGGSCDRESSCAPRSFCGKKATPRTPRRPMRGQPPRRILYDVYQDFLRNVLAMPVIVGRKTAKERFAGAENTMTCEAIMRDGKALQMATSHELGQRFSRAFNISYSSAEGTTELCWTTS